MSFKISADIFPVSDVWAGTKVDMLLKSNTNIVLIIHYPIIFIASWS